MVEEERREGKGLAVWGMVNGQSGAGVKNHSDNTSLLLKHTSRCLVCMSVKPYQITLLRTPAGINSLGVLSGDVLLRWFISLNHFWETVQAKARCIITGFVLSLCSLFPKSSNSNSSKPSAGHPLHRPSVPCVTPA